MGAFNRALLELRAARPMIVSVAVVLLAVAFAAARFMPFVGHRELSASGSYQAFAHLFVGGLIGAWLADRSRSWLIWLVLALSVVELLAFVASRH